MHKEMQKLQSLNKVQLQGSYKGRQHGLPITHRLFGPQNQPWVHAYLQAIAGDGELLEAVVGGSEGGGRGVLLSDVLSVLSQGLQACGSTAEALLGEESLKESGAEETRAALKQCLCEHFK